MNIEVVDNGEEDDDDDYYGLNTHSVLALFNFKRLIYLNNK